MPTTPSYPVALLLDGRSCLVVGGGQVARRKAAALLDAGAVVTVVAPTLVPDLEALSVRVERRAYREGEVAGYHLCCTATGDREVDAAVARDAALSGVLVNAADDPQHCSFILPAVLRRGPVTIAVSTDGVSPAVAVWLRDRVARVLDVDAARLAALAGSARSSLRERGVKTEGLDWSTLLDGLADALGPGAGEDPEEVVRGFVDAALRQALEAGRGGNASSSG